MTDGIKSLDAVDHDVEYDDINRSPPSLGTVRSHSKNHSQPLLKLSILKWTGMATPISTHDGRESARLGESSATNSAFGEPLSMSGLDYEVISQPRKFFKKGRFFMAYWVEPSGSVQLFGREEPEPFSESRYFMVVRSKPGHCLCLSVHTYGQQATAKHGVWPDEYASVIPRGGFEVLSPGEMSLKRQPIQVILENRSITIDASSRIDFSRVYTFEYNIPVRNVGRTIPEDLSKFEAYFSKSINITSMEQLQADQTNITQSSLGLNHVWNFEPSYNATSHLRSTVWEWCFELPQYRRWRTSKHSLLWIVGMSHMESSTLSERLIDYELRCDGRRAICYFSFENDKIDKNSWTIALHSMLLQLLSQRPILAKHLERQIMMQPNKNASSSLTLWATFLTIAERASENILCVLSGLDEGYTGQKRHEIMDCISSLYHDSARGLERKMELSLIITSQSDTDLEFRFSDFICQFPNGGDQPEGGSDKNDTVRTACSEPERVQDVALEDDAKGGTIRPYTLSGAQGVERVPRRHYDAAQGTYASSQYTCDPTIEEPFRRNTRDITRVVARRDHPFSSPRVRCTHPGCPKTFNRVSDMDRHHLDKHNSKFFSCKFSDCDRMGVRAFDRADKLRQHLRERHQFRVQENSRNRGK